MMKAQSKIGFGLLLVCFALRLSLLDARAFALLGPIQPWMQASNGVISAGDIGGPMDLTNEYRWNVPVVTYGFDQSFLDYFGTNGVAAVEGAIKILNDLPPASQIVLTNYPFDSRRINYAAQAQDLEDLKSTALSLLLNQMGLAQPTRYIFVIQRWDPSLINSPDLLSLWWNNGPTNDPVFDFVARLNFDPTTLAPTPYVNATLYSGHVGTNPSIGVNYIDNFTVDPIVSPHPAVADLGLYVGTFYNGLTYDDIGGLTYLLSTNNVNYETLLPGVAGVGTNANAFVDGARRPGVDKITFVRESLDPLTGDFFSPVTNQYTDTYFTNGVLMQQQLARVIYRPDFLFSAGDVDSNSMMPGVSYFWQTGTTNWVNDAALNGNPGGAGPGVIQPPVEITFNKIGRLFVSSGSSDGTAYDESEFYGSFNGSTNAPVSYPLTQAGSGQLSVRVWLTSGQSPNQSVHRFDWETNTTPGTVFAMETSTNLTDWLTLFSVTNNGRACTYFVQNPAGAPRFYRLVPQ